MCTLDEVEVGVKGVSEVHASLLYLSEYISIVQRVLVEKVSRNNT